LLVHSIVTLDMQYDMVSFCNAVSCSLLALKYTVLVLDKPNQAAFND